MGGRGIIVWVAMLGCGGGGSDAGDAGSGRDAATTDAAPPRISRLLFLADQDEDETYELYLAALTDELLGVEKVNASTGDLSVRELGWSLTGDYVLYTAGPLGWSGIELYVVPVDGAVAGDPVRVAVDLARSDDGDVTGTIHHVRWSPDGSAIAFLAEETYDVSRLFVVEPSSEDSPVPLTDVDVDVQDFAWSPDGSSIAFRVRAGEVDDRGLFAVSPAGGTPAKISDDPDISEVEELSFWEEGYGWSPDSRRIFFRARSAASVVMQLYVAEVSGGVPSAPVRVSPEEVDELSGVEEARWSPDSSKLVFLYDPMYDPDHPLYLVDFADSSEPAAVAVSGSIGPSRFPRWSPDSRWVAFTGVDEGPTELFALDLTASPLEPAQVNPPLPPEGGVAAGGRECVSTGWSPDSSLLTYRAIQEEGKLGAVWVSDVSGGAPAPPVKMSGEAVDRGGPACPLRWSPDGSALVYVSDQDENDVFELFLVEPTQPGATMKVNGALVFDGDVRDVQFQRLDFAWSPSGDWIAYRADQDVNERIELYAVRRMAPGESVRVSSLIELGDVVEFAWGP